MARKFIILLATFFIITNVLLVVLVLLRDNSTPSRPMPRPNGYDDFVRAGKLVVLSSSDYTNLNTMARDPLAALVTSNHDALAAVRVGLTHDSLVPDDYSTNYTTDHLPDFATFKQLSQVFRAEGRLAELDGRTNDAAKIYLDGVRFGQDSSRGGVMLSRLVGIACETIAFNSLRPLNDQLDATNSRAVARELEKIDADEDPVEQTLQQEARWARKVGGMSGQIEMLIDHKSVQQTRDRFTAKEQNHLRLIRQTTLSFAARAYNLDKGKPPATAADLVPDYLKAVPKDPTTGRDLSLGP